MAYRPAESGNAPLHAAAGAGHLTMVQLLIQHGATVAIENPAMARATPLMLAQMMDHPVRPSTEFCDKSH